MSEPRLSRREFGQAAAAAALAAAGATPPVTGAPLAQPDPAANEAQHRYDMIRTRYGKHLDAEQLQHIRTQIEQHLRAAERLRKFPVGQDDPAFVFLADVP